MCTPSCRRRECRRLCVCSRLSPALGRATIAAVLLILPSFLVQAASDADATASTEELKHLSLEQLMDVQITSVARHPESLLQAAAAIQVITRDQIRRSGATTLAEALRLADNLEVAQKNSHDWGISARGFNTQLANKLLVMIDGRTVYTPLYSGVFWDVQDYLLEDVERIEVISGPGGTLWGANAVNGVINIITRSAAETHGAYVEAGGGRQPQGFGGARLGGSLAPGVDVRVYAKYLDMDDNVLPSGMGAGDAWHQARGGFRLDAVASDKDNLSVHGDYYSGTEGLVEAAPIAAGNTSTVSGGNLVGRWTHTVSEDSDVSLQTYYDHTHLRLPVPQAVLNGLVLAPSGTLHDDLTTYDLDFQHRFALGDRNQVVWGFGYRYTHDGVQNAPGLAFYPPTLDHNLFSAFLQDELRLAHDWSLILGSKVEHNDYSGYEVEPNVRLQWQMRTNQTLWSAISRAARTPSRIDRDLSEPASGIVVLEGGRNFGSEYVTAYEVGYRGNLGGRVTGSLSTFYNDYNDVRSTSFTPGTIIPLFLANNVEGYTYGAELTSTLQVNDVWSVHFGYDLLKEHLRVKPGQFDLSNARNETSDPQNQLSLRSSVSLAHVEFDATLRWVDELPTNSGTTSLPGPPAVVPSYSELDCRLGWHPSPRWELSLVGRNLLHDHHPEYGLPDPTRVQIERSVYGKVAWTP
jgi:iron complex outermembrane recepter protein